MTKNFIKELNFNIDKKVLTDLVILYNSKERFYHDINHVYFCLSKFSEFIENNEALFSANKINLNIVLYSIWFHDAIYNPFPNVISSNEKESAKLFEQYISLIDSFIVLNKNDLDYTVNTIFDIILKTELHLFDQENLCLEAKIMLDLDLLGFSKNIDLVKIDSENVLREYKALGIDKRVLLSKRVDFIDNLLKRKRIYYTDYFFNKYEKKARDNLYELKLSTISEIALLSKLELKNNIKLNHKKIGISIKNKT